MSLTDKQFASIKKELGKDYMAELEKLSPEALKQRIVQADNAIVEAAEQLEANVKYQEIRANMRALTAGKAAVKKRQTKVIRFCLNLLAEKGENL